MINSISDYWYEKREVPSKEKDIIKKMIHGDYIGTISFSDLKKNLLCVDGIVFKDVFVKNREFLFKGDFTAPPDENDYIDAINYLTDDGLAGFSITKNGWLVSLYSNYSQSGFADAVKNYIVGKAYKLVCITSSNHSKLIEFYKNHFGFSIYAETVNDEKVMRKFYGDDFIDSFIKNNGIPHHVFMIRDAIGNYSPQIRKFDYYFDAEEFVEKTVKRVSH